VNISFFRSAYKWWSSALDNILLVKDWQSEWKKFVDINDRTVMSVKRLLDRCGVKGCLLGGIIATSIAKLVLSIRFFFIWRIFLNFLWKFYKCAA